MLQLSDDEHEQEPAGPSAAPAASGATVSAAATAAAAGDAPEPSIQEDVRWMSQPRQQTENDPSHRQFLLEVLQVAGTGGPASAAVSAGHVSRDILKLATVCLSTSH